MSAFVVWIRDQMPPTEEGKQQWRDLVAWMDTPPTPTVPPMAAGGVAVMSRSVEASAFDAFMNETR